MNNVSYTVSIFDIISNQNNIISNDAGGISSLLSNYGIEHILILNNIFMPLMNTAVIELTYSASSGKTRLFNQAIAEGNIVKIDEVFNNNYKTIFVGYIATANIGQDTHTGLNLTLNCLSLLGQLYYQLVANDINDTLMLGSGEFPITDFVANQVSLGKILLAFQSQALMSYALNYQIIDSYDSYDGEQLAFMIPEGIDGLTTQILSLTNGLLPVILSGGKVSIADNIASVTEGYYRVANQKVNDREIPGYFYAPAAANLNIANGQFIVARINVSDISQYTTIISGKVMVTDTTTDQDVILYGADNDDIGLTTITRGNDLQLIIPAINKSNQLIINNPDIYSLPLKIHNQKTIILAITQNAEITLPETTQGIYSIINSSSSCIYLMPNNGYTILGRDKYLITPGSTIELSPLPINKSWIFL